MQANEPQRDPGFRIPEDKAAQAPTGDGTLSTTPPGDSAGTAGTTGTGIEVAPEGQAPATDTSTRDIAIGGAVFLFLLVIFFFARNAFSNHLVRRRVAPSSADTAGWLLFFGLAFLSAAVVLGFVNSTKFLNVAITGTLLVFGIAAIAGALFTGRR
ncbi:hypothetical protein OU994_27445 [Pseudoduganella sp. SL102]|uniref:Uncharacterized protein n=1 Tax=Pseudoduganella albidiflava TaxID=321983 RepID=A0A411WTP5_9BURK|nr:MULTISPECIES: hypothetical protein [Pseudoduganella]QBI00028.1 hypothetical protein EYF70_03575 [Pseudoduganella albidiflava]WBS01952.1 hypothetical protein OU994_27445 [Pseudoduganella sp. SL102]GGY55680.1 hypothetical protein GCM10007387_42800 [Pseudoduganella albidiflava]